jgi:hypothetical protein
MPAAPAVILLELNELTPRLIERFMAEGSLPNFRRLRDESRVFTTDAEEQGENLNPWIQWVTVHTGLSFAQHGVFRLGEGRRCPAPGIVDLASRAGRRVLQFGSMNVPFQTPLNGAAVPDPWATDLEPYPSELAPYVRFVRQHVLEHTNEQAAASRADTLAFLRFMLGHGLSAGTLAAILRQLVRERSGRYGWQRVAILDLLQWDVFAWYYRRLRPQLATFFLNSVAHLQHTHWRNLEPERFAIQPSPAEQTEYSDAIAFGYRKQDALIGRFLDLAGPETTLVLCTALSQQPCLTWEDKGGKRFYRPHAYEDLIAFAGITEAHRCAPVMSEEFSLRFEELAAAERAETALRGLEVAGEAAFWVHRDGLELYGGCRIHHDLPQSAALKNTSGLSRPFHELLYQAESLKSGIHHPHGILWIRRPDKRHRTVTDPVPLTCVAPTLLRLLDLAPAEAMRGRPLALD